MAATDLRAQIDAAIGPWRVGNDDVKPPFDTTKLVIMALLVSDKSLTRRQVWTWVIASFYYYGSKAADALWDWKPKATDTSTFWDWDDNADADVPEVQALQRSLDEVYCRYDLPLKVTLASHGTGAWNLYTMSPAAGQKLLGLDSAVDNTIFPFFELPPELRNTIYTMMFQYPASSLYFGDADRKPKVLSRDLDDATSSRPVVYQTRKPYSTKNLSDILSPVLTNRQFYDEAMPIFFNLNTFYFLNQAHMHKAIGNLPEVCRKHIKSVGFTYTVNQAGDVRDAQNFGILTRLPNLRRLSLWFHEEMWNRRREGSMQDGEDLPGVQILRRIRGLNKVEFINCPSLQKGLEQEMMRPKAIRDSGCKRCESQFERSNRDERR
ncbi:hypothetical protein LTR15_012345 [Elasticomyces elasticus]|nr:hypothetical protein LTR15_012345 [Elasticomyces elasticus]